MSPDRFEALTRYVAKRSSRRALLKGMAGAVAAGVGAAVLKPFRGEAATVCPAGTGVCGTACCPAGGGCANASASCCCDKGQTPCNLACCKSGVACADHANSVCGCPAGTTPCGSGTSLKCCQGGTACSPTNETCQPVANFQTTAKTCGPGCKPAFAPCTSDAECCTEVCTSGFCIDS